MLPANNYSRVFFFYFKKTRKKMINEFNSKIFGKQNDGEFLKIKLIDIEDLFKVSSSASVIIGQTLLKKWNIIKIKNSNCRWLRTCRYKFINLSV